MSDLIRRNEVLEELNKYEKELRKDKTEAIETDDEQMMFAITNQETAICRIRRNILHIPTAYDVDKVEQQLEELKEKGYVSGITNNPYEFGAVNALDNAIKIVKAGGVNGQS